MKSRASFWRIIYTLLMKIEIWPISAIFSRFLTRNVNVKTLKNVRVRADSQNYKDSSCKGSRKPEVPNWKVFGSKLKILKFLHSRFFLPIYEIRLFYLKQELIFAFFHVKFVKLSASFESDPVLASPETFLLFYKYKEQAFKRLRFRMVTNIMIWSARVV